MIQFILAIFVIAGILIGSLRYLDYYTLHGEEITVPELIGMDKKDLKEYLTEKNLKYNIIDSSFVLDVSVGSVLGQNPAPLSKVKKDRTIYITVNAANPPFVPLPLLTDKSLRQAKSIIENVGLKLGQLIYIPDQCVNCVLAQRINNRELQKDTSIPKGTVIDLILGQGLSDEKILVPLLINLTREEAIEKLKSSYLNIGAELYDDSVFDDEDSASARVFAQYPSYDIQSWIQMGSSVDVEFTMNNNKIDTNTVIIDTSKIAYPDFE